MSVVVGEVKKPSVLIVEDEGIVADDLQQTLLAFGYDAYALAISADEAILRATARCPDLVLMDIRIKGRRDGVDAAAILHEQFGVPVVFLTAHADEATMHRARQTSPYGYLTKPVRPPELRSAIEIALFRHDLERRLRERERWFSTTLSSIADAVITVDLRGRITFANHEAERLVGLPIDELVGKPSRDVLRLIDDKRNAIDSPLDRALQEHRPRPLENVRIINVATGAVRAVSDSVAAVVDANRPLGAVMVFRDVTEQLRLRQQLELADRLASLGTLAAGVAHEVNNPLAVIVANVELAASDLDALREAAGPAAHDSMTQLAGSLEDIRAAADRIARIVSDLRAFSRPTEGGNPVSNVGGALDWALRTTAHELRDRAQIVTNLEPVPDVVGDEVRLGQVLVNLLLNAAHAIEPGNVPANTVEVTTTSDGASVVVEIRDTGCGIPEELRKHIFEPFFTTKGVGRGTGLGLSICHGIVTSFGGRLELESEVGIGTTMRVVLPVARTTTSASAPVAHVREVPRARILVIDDEPLVLRAIQKALRDHDVRTVDRAEAALEAIDAGERFDVIFSDVTMPTMSGIQFYEALLQRSPELAKRVVFITGGAISTATQSFLESAHIAWIEKPFSARQLEDAVAERVRKPAR